MAKYLMVKKINVYIPGDERSRLNPGHGYPERNETYEMTSIIESDDALNAYLNSTAFDPKVTRIYAITDELTFHIRSIVDVKRKPV